MNLTLFCCLVGSNTPFSVRISSSLTVDELKEMIKEKKPNDLKEIDADKLSLFKVSIPDEDDLAQKLEDAVKASKPLRSTKKLSKLFSDEPPEETVHIAVKLPDDARESFAFGPCALVHPNLCQIQPDNNDHATTIFSHPVDGANSSLTLYFFLRPR